MLNTDKINGKETYHGLDMGAERCTSTNLAEQMFATMPKHDWRLTPSNFRELTEWNYLRNN